ncbi:GAF domain-containing protein [Paenibacillus albicereus]|uniref:GAF domain-containing protein n=1 Tax=Paenibacillus albicereus TaxID=2726185 RepID=A0A6H2GU86_9BACL|nr:GAF domain-containing protein [Paenibacillus albicereus]QJC50952.1 GAF domain-containing protein [Paenibacillus albicereus]
MTEGEKGGQEELERLRRELGCDVAVAGVAAQGGGLRWKAASGAASDRYRIMAERPGRGLAGTVLKVGRPMALQAAELRAGRQLQDYPLLIAEGLCSAYAVPLLASARPSGVLLIGSRSPKAFADADRLAAQAAARRLEAIMVGGLGSRRDRDGGREPRAAEMAPGAGKPPGGPL